MIVDTSAVTRAQLGNLLEALEAVVVTRADLSDFGQAIQEALPALIRANEPPAPRCTPIGFRLDVVRDRDGWILQIIARPDPTL